MSIIGSNILAGAAGASGAATGYQIERSLRFNSADSSYIHWTPSSAGNRKRWTWSGWVKRADLGDEVVLFSGSASPGANYYITFSGGTGTGTGYDGLSFFYGYGIHVGTAASTFRDPSAWYHIVVVLDTTEATAANRVKIYVNGTEITYGYTNYPSQNADLGINTSYRMSMGAINSYAAWSLSDVYMAEVHFVDGQALTPSSFGEFDSNTGVWNPKEFDGNYTLANPNDGSNWSSGSQVTGSTGLANAGNMFNGNTSNYASISLTSDGYILWTPSSAVAYGNKVEIYTYAPTGYSIVQYYSLNGGTETQFGLPGNSYGWTTVATGSGSITSLKVRLTRTAPDQSAVQWGAIRVDGVVLQNNTTGSTIGGNSFYLKFADNSSNAALGTDSSGNSNTWTVNNLTAADNGYIRGTSGAFFYGSREKLFNGNTGDGLCPGSSGTAGTFDVTVTFNPAISCTSLQVWSANKQNSASGSVSVNGGTYQSVPGTGSYTTLTAPSGGTLSSLVLRRVAASSTNNLFTFHAIKVNGSVLSDVPGEDVDCLVDTPTNYGTDSGAGGEVRGNYATWNPLTKTGGTLTNGNLEFTGSNWKVVAATIMLPKSGKYYLEATVGGTPYSASIGALYHAIGLIAADTLSSWSYSANNSCFVSDVGWLQNYSTDTNVGPFANGTVIGLAINIDSNEITVYVNGSSATTATIGIAAGTDLYVFNASYSTSYGALKANFGQREWAYAAPSNYKSLCTQNLPEPTIADGSAYFDTKLYTGNGSTQTISGYNFSPDFVWLKLRSGSSSVWHVLADTIRGNNALFSNATNGEIAGYVNGFTSDGFGVQVSPNDTANKSGGSYVAWAWDAGANSSKTYAVTVVSDSGNKYRFDGFGTSAVTLELEEGSTYTFDQSDSSNAGHPLRFSTTSNGTHGGGSEYTTGVVTSGTPGSAGAYTKITIAASAPTLYYYCTQHSGMGGQINTNSTAGASNFDGSIQATVRANPTAGFSVVSYTGNNTNSTVGHGLNAAPGMVIVKNRDQSYNWSVYHDSLAATQCLLLNSTGATISSSPQFNNSKTTSTTFPIGAGGNTNYPSGSDLIAYCFAPVEGYSAMGSYTGNGSDDGPFVFTGMRPKWVLIKASSSTSYGNWIIHDSERSTVNVSNKNLYANLTNAEDTTYAIDFLANGFKIRSSSYDAHNGSGKTYIYAAFAENPFRTARAR